MRAIKAVQAHEGRKLCWDLPIPKFCFELLGLRFYAHDSRCRRTTVSVSSTVPSILAPRWCTCHCRCVRPYHEVFATRELPWYSTVLNIRKRVPGDSQSFSKNDAQKRAKSTLFSKIDHGNRSKSSQPARFLKVLAEMNQIAVCVLS